jgi:hypothetical protein
MKRCKDCNIEFEPTGRNHKRCKPCGKIHSKKVDQITEKNRYHKTGKFKLTERKYGVDVEQYNKMFNDQNGCCAICGTHQTNFEKSLAVDHCHSSRKVRGLLCTNCNLMLGCAKDNENILLSALQYLKK